MWYEELLDNPEAEAEFDAYMTRLYEEAIADAAAERHYEEMQARQEEPLLIDDIGW